MHEKTVLQSDIMTIGAAEAPSAPAAKRTLRQGTAVRRLALLGGTTTMADCWTALAYLARPDRLVRGPAIARYEQAFARRIGVAHGISFSHGRVGLYGLLRALGIGSGDEILLQVPTHIVVPNAVRYAGAQPVYVDCEADTYNMDLEVAERRVTPRSKAIVVQHTFGIPVDLRGAMDLAERHGLVLIEDCVHALGARYAERPVGSFGRAAFFSTEETKTISTTMGGIVVTDDPALAERLRRFQTDCAPPSVSLTARYVLKLAVYHLLTEPRLHRYTRSLYERFGRRNPLPGPTTPEEIRGERPAHYEQRFSNAQAALGLRQLSRLETNVRHRRAIVARYEAALAQHRVQPPRPPAEATPAYVRYPVQVSDRDAAVQAVSPRAVLGTWFTSVLEEAVSPGYGAYVMGSCPRAEAAARQLVNLPTHPRVTAADADAIVSVMAGHVAHI
jgi:dTDP-4-amino-4,6-dideoxygalactose transaminase